jgi:hypothetical protein
MPKDRDGYPFQVSNFKFILFGAFSPFHSRSTNLEIKESIKSREVMGTLLLLTFVATFIHGVQVHAAS